MMDMTHYTVHKYTGVYTRRVFVHCVSAPSNTPTSYSCRELVTRLTAVVLVVITRRHSVPHADTAAPRDPVSVRAVWNK